MEKKLKQLVFEAIEAEKEKLPKGTTLEEAKKQAESLPIDELQKSVRSIVKKQCKAIANDDDLNGFYVDSEVLANAIVCTVIANTICKLGQAVLKKSIRQILVCNGFDIEEKDDDPFLISILKVVDSIIK